MINCFNFILFNLDETMLSAGKIYVVVGVMLIIFIGLIIYLISMDRKIKKLEDEIKNNKKE